MGCRKDFSGWTPTEDAELKAYHARGLTAYAISRRMDRPESSVRSRLASLEKKKTTRPCMCCRREFTSEGSHNRLCSFCRPKNTSPYAP